MTAVKPPSFDPANFNNDPHLRKISKPWGYELHWVPEGFEYLGKVLHIEAGKRLSLQLHDAKHEAYFLISGQAKIIWDNDQGELVETELKPYHGYHTSVGQRHRLCGITDCDIIEVSTPETGTTWRLEDDYSRPDETPEQRKIERGEV